MVLLLVLLAGAALLVLHSTGGSSTKSPGVAQQPTPGNPGPGPTSPTTATKSTSQCSLPGGNQAIPEATPQGITWSIYQTVALPFSTADGPQIVDGDVARCYAHNPIGALLAASQIPYRYLVANDWRKVNAVQVMPGAGRDAFEVKRATASNQGGNQPGDYNQLAGFKFVTYSPVVAVIEVVSRNNQGGMQAGPVTMDWSNGDWKLQLQPDGSSSPQELPVQSLVGFSIWAGV